MNFPGLGFRPETLYKNLEKLFFQIKQYLFSPGEGVGDLFSWNEYKNQGSGGRGGVS